MFKKLIHISISILLLTVTAGFTLSKHYCGSRLVTISIDHEEEPCCDMGDKCCHNETKVFQLHEDYIASPILENNLVNTIDIFLVNHILINNNLTSVEQNEVIVTESPPPKDLHTNLSNLQVYLC